MYLRTTQRRNEDGSVVRYYALAENVRHPEKGHVEARVVHSFGRADRLDRAALEWLLRSIRRVLDANDGEAPPAEKGHDRAHLLTRPVGRPPKKPRSLTLAPDLDAGARSRCRRPISTGP